MSELRDVFLQLADAVEEAIEEAHWAKDDIAEVADDQIDEKMDDLQSDYRNATSDLEHALGQTEDKMKRVDDLVRDGMALMNELRSQSQSLEDDFHDFMNRPCVCRRIENRIARAFSFAKRLVGRIFKWTRNAKESCAKSSV